jgi:hypothetical protein
MNLKFMRTAAGITGLIDTMGNLLYTGAAEKRAIIKIQTL